MTPSSGPLVVAHRAGNDLTALQRALDLGVDVVEADVHARGPLLELRHSKHLRPLPLLWDRGAQGLELTRTTADGLVLPTLLDALDAARPARDGAVRRPVAEVPGPAAGAPPDQAARPALLLDLKGPGRVGARVAELVAARSRAAPVLVCSRWWPGVDALATAPGVRPVLTARNRVELARLLRRLQGTRVPYGVSVHPSLLTPSVGTALREGVELVLTWGVNDRALLDRVLGLGVNGVISDSADVLRELLAAR